MNPDYDIKYTFRDKGYSGKSINRPAFTELIKAIEDGRVDAVVVYRLDRLTRSATTAMRLILDWIQKDIELFVVDQPILNATKEDPFRLTKYAMFSELAEVERQVTVSRVKAGLAAAKARGVKLGADPKLTDAQRSRAVAGIAAGKTYRAMARELGVSPSTVHRVAKYTD